MKTFHSAASVTGIGMAMVVHIGIFSFREWKRVNLLIPGLRAVRARRGLRFDPSKLLLDPYGRAIGVPKKYSRDTARLIGRAASSFSSILKMRLPGRANYVDNSRGILNPNLYPRHSVWLGQLHVSDQSNVHS